jgi:hypothetical protein
LISSVQEFQERVPIRTYEDLWNGYWKAEFSELNDYTWPGTIPYFALTAGTTTGVTKYIPVRAPCWTPISVPSRTSSFTICSIGQQAPEGLGNCQTDRIV